MKWRTQFRFVVQQSHTIQNCRTTNRNCVHHFTNEGTSTSTEIYEYIYVFVLILLKTPKKNFNINYVSYGKVSLNNDSQVISDRGLLLHASRPNVMSREGQNQGQREPSLR